MDKGRSKPKDSEEKPIGATEVKQKVLRPSASADAKHGTENEKENDDDSKFRGRIDVHTLNYFKRVEKFLEEDSFEDDDSRELFINNVIAQIGEGLQTCQLAKHRLTSKVLEQLLSMCSTAQMVSMFKSLKTDLLAVADDRFGSHVVQKIITLIPIHCCVNRQKDPQLRQQAEKIVQSFHKKTKHLTSELIRSMYCCHILSSFIQVLAGIQVTETVSRSRNSRETRSKFFGNKSAGRRLDTKLFGNLLKEKPVEVPEDFKKTLRKLTTQILADDNFGELLCHRNASPVIQTLMLGLKENHPDLCNKLCDLIIQKSKILEWNASVDPENMSVPILFADEVGSHIMEKIFYVMSPELFEEIFKKCFIGNLLTLCQHPLANFILQHMLVTVPNANMAKLILEELIPFTEDVLASGNMGVIVRIAELSLNYKCMQKDLVRDLKKSFHMPRSQEGSQSFMKLLLTMSTYDVLFGKEEKEDAGEGEKKDADETLKENKTEEATGKLTKEMINYHGACLVKILLQFENPTPITRGLLILGDEIVVVANHIYGSFVVEAFLTSSTITKIKKQKFRNCFQKDIVTMATNKFGSHVIDKIWNHSNTEEKKLIKDELLKNKSLLRGNMYGRIILRNCELESFQDSMKIVNEESAKMKIDKQASIVVETAKEGSHNGEEGKNEKKGKKSKRKRKMAKVDESTSYVKEFQILGVGIGNDTELPAYLLEFEEETLKKPKNEIDELFECFNIKPNAKTETRKT
eukprot:gene19153-21073_t